MLARFSRIHNHVVHSRSPTDPEQVNETNNAFSLLINALSRTLCSNERRLIVALSPAVTLCLLVEIVQYFTFLPICRPVMEYDLVDDEGILMSDYSLLRRRQNKHIRSRRICIRDSLFVGKKYGAVSVRRHDSIDVGLGSVCKAIDLECQLQIILNCV